MFVRNYNPTAVNLRMLIYSNIFTPHEEKAYSWVHTDRYIIDVSLIANISL